MGTENKCYSEGLLWGLVGVYVTPGENERYIFVFTNRKLREEELRFEKNINEILFLTPKKKELKLSSKNKRS